MWVVTDQLDMSGWVESMRSHISNDPYTTAKFLFWSLIEFYLTRGQSEFAFELWQLALRVRTSIEISSAAFIEHMVRENAYPADLMADDLDQRYPWLLQCIWENSCLYIAECVGTSWTLIPGKLATVSATNPGVALFEPFTTMNGYC